jgi:hypothetical protein
MQVTRIQGVASRWTRIQGLVRNGKVHLEADRFVGLQVDKQGGRLQICKKVPLRMDRKK